jgi:hypothetical protein
MGLTELETELQHLTHDGCWLIQHELPNMLTWEQREEAVRKHNDEVTAVKEAIADLQEWREGMDA